MQRRDFIVGLGAAGAWPVAVRAQQGDRVRRIGVLMLGDENDPEQKRRLTAFMQALGDLGWINGRDLRMDVRWGGGDTNRIRAVAQELVGLRPEIILTGGLPATVAVQRETRTIRIVFVNVAIPSPAALSRGSTAQVRTSLDLLSTNPPWEASGFSCSRRLRPGSSEPQYSIPTQASTYCVF
jgi:putative ABC transport system substrate-binding protein